MRQQTLADDGFERFRKQRVGRCFLEMDQIIPWRDLCKVIKPFIRQGAGRPDWIADAPSPFLQHWFTFQIPAVERRCIIIVVPSQLCWHLIWVASREPDDGVQVLCTLLGTQPQLAR